MAYYRFVIAVALICGSVQTWSQRIPLIIPDEVISKADVLYDSGKFSEAISLLKTIPERDTAYAQIQQRLANFYIANKEFDKAITVCQQPLKDTTEDRSLFLRLEAVATEKSIDYKTALTLFEKALKQYPTDTDLMFSLGLIQYNN